MLFICFPFTSFWQIIFFFVKFFFLSVFCLLFFILEVYISGYLGWDKTKHIKNDLASFFFLILTAYTRQQHIVEVFLLYIGSKIFKFPQSYKLWIFNGKLDCWLLKQIPSPTPTQTHASAKINTRTLTWNVFLSFFFDFKQEPTINTVLRVYCMCVCCSFLRSLRQTLQTIRSKMKW